MQPSRSQPSVTQDFGTPGGEWLVDTTRQVSFLQTDVFQHRLRDSDVLRLPAVRRACESELVDTPFELCVRTRVQERHELERLGARAPGRDKRRIARGSDELLAHDGGVNPVVRLDDRAARDDDV